MTRLCKGHTKLFGDELEQIGRISDTADNLSHAAKLPLGAELHVKYLTDGLVRIRDDLRKLYVELANDNPWTDWEPPR